ncbi:OmpH family outer membrane protein [Terrimonas alba]|uniref:OmpH family outer membrane protein n=1 Tax=Terrimonas alba TaxID=3349636 RepID=UPI0035F24077
MKNGLLVWNIVLTLLVGYLLFAQLNKKGTVVSGNKNVNRDSNVVNAGFRIAYFEMDSVENHFNMVKDIKAEIAKKDEEYTNSLGKLDATYRNKIQEYQQKEKSGTMVQADYEKAQVELRQLEDRLKNMKQELDQQYQDFVMRKNLGVKKKIEDFLTEYNKTQGYSYIVAFEQGLFYYKDSAYNITSDVIKGLNEEYKDKKD